MAADTLGSYGSMARCYILPQSVFSDCFQLWELDDFLSKSWMLHWFTWRTRWPTMKCFQKYTISSSFYSRFPDLNRIMKVFENKKQRNNLMIIFLLTFFILLLPPLLLLLPLSFGYFSPAPLLSCLPLSPLFFQVNDTTVLGAGGDYADFQFISDVSDQLSPETLMF